MGPATLVGQAFQNAGVAVEAEIPGALTRLEGLLQRLENTTGDLALKLSEALGPESAQTAGAQAKQLAPYASPMGGRLNYIVDRLETGIDVLGDLRRRVQL